MMFVPIEPAYLVAIQNDPELWGYAYSKRILLISPTNLIASLKLIADIWKREYQSKNALDIVKRGELLYDKFVGFATSINSIGTHLSNTQSAYDNALSQLKDGRGNLVWQAIQLKNLGLKSSNQIPRNLIPTDVDITEDETTYNKNQ
jgi:DNA recombination protein RmuC